MIEQGSWKVGPILDHFGGIKLDAKSIIVVLRDFLEKIPSLKPAVRNSSHLKMDGWNTFSFPFGMSPTNKALLKDY